MDIKKFLNDVPLLHSWDGGITWNTGGFTAADLQGLDFCRAKLPDGPAIFETGAGNSTICFLHLSPSRLVSIAPEPLLFERRRITDARTLEEWNSIPYICRKTDEDEQSGDMYRI